MKTNPFFTPVDEIIFQNRIIQISGPVGSELSYEVNRQMLALEKMDAKKPIYLFIDSPGGAIDTGFSIFDTAQFIQNEVYTIVCGLAASMGSLIALCAKKENRFSMPNSKFLIHQPLIGGTMHGSASEIDIQAKEIIRTKERINRLYARETGKSYDVVRAATDRDNWMTAEEALEFGLISKIVKSRSEIPGF